MEMTQNSNDDDEEATDNDDDDTTEVIDQPHPRHQEPPARSPLLSASVSNKFFYIFKSYKL